MPQQFRRTVKDMALKVRSRDTGMRAKQKFEKLFMTKCVGSVQLALSFFNILLHKPHTVHTSNSC